MKLAPPVTSGRRFHAPRRRTSGWRWLVATLVSVLALTSLWVGPVANAGTPHPTIAETAAPAAQAPLEEPADEPAAEPALQPSVHYEQAMAHAGDPNRFTPGGRVTVPFRPRADDGWPIDGRAPVALPAGSQTGVTLAREPQGIGTNGADPANALVPVAPIDGSSGLAMRAQPVSAQAPAPATANTVSPQASSGLRKQVFGFLPYWEVDSNTVLNYNLLSTIAYFSVGADKNGNLLKKTSTGATTTGWGGWTSSRMTGIINTAHSRGTRIVLTISVFAWSTGQKQLQGALLGNPSARLNLARQAAAAVRARGADGINLDFEPIASGYADEFAALVRTVRQQLNAIRSGYQLTFDTTGFIGNYPLEAATASGAADAVFVMGYDYRTASSSPVGSIAPYRNAGYDITDTMLAYLDRVPASKIILGVPYYGRAWSTSSSALHAANIGGTKYGTSSSVNYSTAVTYLSQYGRRFDSLEKVAWTAYKKQTCTSTYGCVTSWRQLYVDDSTALRAKYDLVNRMGLRGAGMWALGYDGARSELWTALRDKFLNDTTPPEAGITIMSTAAPDEGLVVRWTAWDDSGVSSYDVQVSVDRGAWTTWLSTTTATSGIYLGHDGHTYAFRVRAKDRKGHLSPWNVTSTGGAPALATGGFARVLVDGVAMRIGHDTGAGQMATLSAGQTLAITAGPWTDANGMAWVKVTGPINAWGPVGFTQVGGWVAVGPSSGPYLAKRLAPNATTIDAGISGFSFGGLSTKSLGATNAGFRAFSPNGDGRRDALQIDWRNNRTFDSLDLRVLRTDGVLVGTISLDARGAAGQQHYDWNGAAGGSTVADGKYLMQLVGMADGAAYRAPSAAPATAAQIATFAVTVDRVAPKLTAASVSGSPFSPNGDRVRDTIRASVASTGASGWIYAAAPIASDGSVGDAVRTASGPGGTSTFAWDGRTSTGAVAPDGRYRLTIGVSDAAANVATRSFDVVLDVRAAVVDQTTTTPSFSPNGDGAGDSATLRWTGDEPTSGRVTIVHGSTLIKLWTYASMTRWSTTWKGTDRSGRAVPDGRYTFVVDGRDRAGNHTVARRTVVVDRTAGGLRWSPNAFAPSDGDAYAATSRIGFRLTRTATITLRLYDAAGVLVRSVWTGRSMTSGLHGFTWNGRDGAGKLVPAGSYVARLTVVSSLGTSVLTRAITAQPFLISRSAASVSAGQTLTLTIRSVEPLKTTPRITFTQPGRAAVIRTATALGGGLYRVSFRILSGAAGTATISVSALDRAGHTNTTKASVLIR